MPGLRPALLRLTLLAVLLLTACTPVAGTPGLEATRLTPTPRSTATQTLTPTPARLIDLEPQAVEDTHIQVWHAFTGPAAETFLQQAALFNTLNEWGIVVFPTAFASHPDLFDAVDAALGSADLPEMAAALPEQTLAWDAGGVVVDLGPYLGDYRYGLSAAELSDIPSVFWAQDETGGRRLGVPALRSGSFLFYNQTWAGELGFEGPPVNAEEFRRQVCAANASFRLDEVEQNDGYGGWIVDADSLGVLSWLLAFDGGVTEGNGYRFATPPNQAALEFLKGLYDDNCAWITTQPSAFDPFARRTALFISADLSEVPLANLAMAQAGNADEWTVLPFPGPQGRAMVVYGPSYSLLETTPEGQLAAWLFIRWLLSAENQSRWAQATGLFPLRASALAALADYSLEHPQWDAAVGYLSAAETVPRLASWRTVRYVLGDGALHIFRFDLPLEDIPAVLEQMDATAADLAGGE